MASNDIILICLDRDGTINLDENFYLGSQPHWKEQLSFLPGVVDGITLLNGIPNAKIVIITNQSGVALEGPAFELLTEQQAHDVNQHIITELAKRSARIDGYQMCPYVTSDYAKKAAEKGRVVNQKYIDDNAHCMKPNIGMLEGAAKMFGATLTGIEKKFMVGDRATDVEMGIRGGCASILIESFKTRELGDVEKVRAMSGEIFIAKDFLDAARQIKARCH